MGVVSLPFLGNKLSPQIACFFSSYNLSSLARRSLSHGYRSCVLDAASLAELAEQLSVVLYNGLHLLQIEALIVVKVTLICECADKYLEPGNGLCWFSKSGGSRLSSEISDLISPG